MKLILILILNISFAWAQKAQDPINSYKNFIDSKNLELSRADLVIGEHVINMIKMVDNGYINQEVLVKLTAEIEKSKHYRMFIPWLKSIHDISKIKETDALLVTCKQYSVRKETVVLEKVLERMAGNYCRERALEAISREIDKTNSISDSSTQFIQENLKNFLVKKNKKNFAFFIQSQTSKPEILRKLSQEVTTYSVRNEIVPSQEVLKDILINEQITKLIQDKGFNPLQHQNVFYAEFGKLIESGYRTLDGKPSEDKIKEHFNFLKNYLELNQDHLPVGLCLTRMNDFAKAVFRSGNKDLSRDIFKFIVKKNNKEIHEDALFFYLWTYMSLNEFKDALKIAEKNNLLKDKSSVIDPRLKFWIGYSYEETDQKKDAISYYEDIVSNHPLSYYSIMATKKLQVMKPDSEAVSFYAKNTVKDLQPISVDIKDFDDDYISSLVRLRAWAKIDSQRMMNLELKRISTHSFPAFISKQAADKQGVVKSDLHLVNARIIQESQNYLNTFRYLYKIMDKKEVVFNRALLEILYPRPFLQELTKTLKNDSVDPLIVLSLIRQESVFNPLAKSPVGARGLMQLMPATARRMKKSTRDKHLVDPKTNLELGTKYFKGLVKRYDGNLVYVLSAYNAGEGRVERWKNLYFDTDETILKNIEAIPFLETRNYVKLIFRNIFFYKLLSDQQELADNNEFNKIFDVSLGFKK